MHACLRVLDIQYLIFSYCAEISTRATLAALTQTCSQLYGPAMDALWYRVDGFSPLLHCLPSHLFSARSCSDVWIDYGERRELASTVFCRDAYNDLTICLQYFGREPSPEDWDSFFKHAHRIRDMNLHLGRPSICGATIYSNAILRSILEQIRLRLTDLSQPPLFPNILTLRCQWSSFFDTISGCVPRLFGARLRSVWVSKDAPQNSSEFQSFDKFLLGLKTGYGMIEDLGVFSGFSTKDVFGRCSAELSELVSSLPFLRAFHSNILIDERAVRYLSVLRNLTKLSCRIPELPEGYSPTHIIESLVEVSLYAPNLESCTSFLKANRTPALQCLELQFNSPCSSSVVHACLEAIAPSTSLRELKFWADRVAYGFYQPRPCTITPRSLSLLYGLRELEELHIEEHIQLNISDDDALQMAKAWPNMRKLVLMACTGTGSDEDLGYPQPTFQALMHFAKHCPHISQLGLAFDASDIDAELLEGLKEGEVGKHLRVLEVHPPFSFVEDPRHVAQSLCRLFPNLPAVRFSSTDLARINGWLHVSTAVHSMYQAA